MRYSQALIPTTREAPADARTLGAALLFRGGFTRGSGSVPATWLPLGRRVLANLEILVRAELDTMGAQELSSSTPWVSESFADRALELLRSCQLTSHHLPVASYQLVGGSPQLFAVGLDESDEWAAMTRARFESTIRSIASACGVPPATAACSDHGGPAVMFWCASSAPGAVEIALDRHTGYAAAAAVAERAPPSRPEAPPIIRPVESVLTPNVRTVAEVASSLDVRPADIIKTIVVIADGTPTLACIPGDRALSLALLREALETETLELATPAEVLKHLACPIGFVGPVDTPLPVIADIELRHRDALVCGAGEADAHLRNVDVERDVPVTRWAAVASASDGDRSPRSGEAYEWLKVRELGRVASLGQGLARRLGCTVRGPGGKLIPFVHAAHVDLGAVLLAAAERHATPTGIAWPLTLAPFAVSITVIGTNADCAREGERLYRALQEQGISVLLDDRPGKPGAKLTDAELIGAPLRVSIGPRSIKANEVEIRHRGSEDAQAIAAGDAAVTIADALERMRKIERQGRS